MTAYADQLFASLDRDLELERIAGGNETEVYRTDDRRHVVKLKNDLGVCWEAAFAAPAASNTQIQFRDKSN